MFLQLSCVKSVPPPIGVNQLPCVLGCGKHGMKTSMPVELTRGRTVHQDGPRTP